MREPLRDRERLAHIIAAADNIARYTEGKSYDDLQANDMMGYAVVYNILAIGEAAYKLDTKGSGTYVSKELRIKKVHLLCHH